MTGTNTFARGGYIGPVKPTHYSISEEFIRGAEKALESEYGTVDGRLDAGTQETLAALIVDEIFRQREEAEK